MKRALMMTLSCVLVAGRASADLRIDPRPAKPPAVSDAPSTPPALTDAPSTPPQDEPQGCAARSQMAPEWVLALGVLGLGLWGLRRTSPRPVPV